MKFLLSTLLTVTTLTATAGTEVTYILKPFDKSLELFAHDTGRVEISNISIGTAAIEAKHISLGECSDDSDNASCKRVDLKKAPAVVVQVSYESFSNGWEATELYIPAEKFSTSELQVLKSGKASAKKSLINLQVKRFTKQVPSMDEARSETCQSDSGTIPGCVRDIQYVNVPVEKVKVKVSR